MTTKILTVLGARPQFIKASVVSAAIAADTRLQEIVVHTGQHFDSNMSDVFFDELGMNKPKHQLDIHGGGHGEMTGRMLGAVEQVLLAERPDIVMVYGDTNSTLAGALAAAKLHIPVAHIEAGLRSFNMRMPEEINRVLTDRVSRWLFTPTRSASENLISEGVPESAITQVGDVMFDVALQHGARVTEQGGALQRLGLTPREYVLVTVHRAENTDDPQRLRAIMQGLEQVAANQTVVWPLHPRTRATLTRLGLLENLRNRFVITDPVGYLDMVQLEKYAALIATDSGGVQKEAFFHRVPCVTLRDETEWVELVDAGWNLLTPPQSADAITAACQRALTIRPAEIQPYGTGDAARIIATHLAG
ncbi:UDP-N-acetylglucosamine 2-epimerase (non-hydrolyzing) [Achromobacter xylosoxidans]|uniref:non-hydrolyzing UDP-N-acetylglucosamine 2-epimerase n=1 Tax=Alcaligenes xylosoxydans xylosoxydans TaxID=85698 RepID=UPI0032087D4A